MNSCCLGGSIELDVDLVPQRVTPWSRLERRSTGEWIKINPVAARGVSEAAVLRALSSRYKANVPFVVNSCVRCGALETAHVGVADAVLDARRASLLCAEMCKHLSVSSVASTLPLVSPSSLAERLYSIARAEPRLEDVSLELSRIAKSASRAGWGVQVIHGDFHLGNVRHSLEGEIVIFDWSDTARLLIPSRERSDFGSLCRLLLQVKGLCDLFESPNPAATDAVEFGVLNALRSEAVKAVARASSAHRS